jgi:tetratricopeptide (TPR) repeat protein
MKFTRYLLIFTLIVLMFSAVWAERKGPLKNVGALLTQARIEMRANPPRYESALSYFDEVLEMNGPTPEAYYHRGNILGEFASKEYDLPKKIETLRGMAANYDSLFISCDSKDIEKKWKDDCDKYIMIVDSIKVFYWKDSYNTGVGMITQLDENYLPNVKNAVDPTEEESARTALSAAADTGKLHFQAALAVDRDDYRPREGIGIIYDRLQQYDSSATWFLSALESAPDTISLIQNVAYAYIQSNDWDNSITYFNRLLEFVPDDANMIMNVAICYNNKEMYDSSYVYNARAIRADPSIAGPQIDVGQYFLFKSQEFSDSIMYYKKEDNKVMADVFIKNQNDYLDSAALYFKGGIDLEPENTFALEQYAIVKLVRGDYPAAEEGFKNLTELDPEQKDHWVNLGDTYIQQQKFEEAIVPFEKALELDPGDVRLWETIIDLYESAKMPDKAKEARARAEELKNL